MRTALAVTSFVLAAALNLTGASLPLVTLPDSVEVGGKTLVLNGVGQRSRLMFKVYVGGMYVEQKSADANALIEAEAPKRMVVHFMRSRSRDQLVEAYREAFANNAPDARKTLQKEIDSLMNAFEAVNVGDEMFFTYVPGSGTTLTIKGIDRVTIPGRPFGRAMFSAWLGPKPPSTPLKQGLLGK